MRINASHCAKGFLLILDLISTKIPRGKYYCPHFTVGKIKTQRGCCYHRALPGLELRSPNYAVRECTETYSQTHHEASRFNQQNIFLRAFKDEVVCPGQRVVMT